MALVMKYFVLKPKGGDEQARASRAAMLAYAEKIKEHDQELAQQLREWVAREEVKAV